MMALKFKDFTLKNNLPKIILLVIALLLPYFCNGLQFRLFLSLTLFYLCSSKINTHDIYSAGKSNALKRTT